MTTNYIKRTPSKMKNRIIAIITVIMMVISILSLTTLAAAEDAYYTAVMEAPNEYAPNEVPLNETESNAASESDNEQGSGDESNEPDSSASDENTDSDIGNDADVELPYDNSNSQNDDSHYEYDAYESEGEYECDGEYCDEEQCKCECEYYCDYDCKCECDYVEIEAYTDFIVTDWDGLYDVFTNSMITDGPYSVDVVGSAMMSAQLNVPAGRTVHLSGGVLHQPTANARHFTVDGTLVLNGITLRGTSMPPIAPVHRGGIAVNASGELIMNVGSIIEGNYANWGGGVNNNGTFTMNGGEIRRNFAVDQWVTATGGGVYNSGTFIMNDGLIYANYANMFGGGVYNVGEFFMNGGSVSDNGAQDNGGGVYVRSGTFTMHEGEISRNGAELGSGAGISVSSNGTFIMHNGEISENRSTFSGGGVVNSGTFTMYGGTISRNSSRNGNWQGSTAQGGGVLNQGTFTMNDGVISNNTAHSNSPLPGMVARGEGGGVFNGSNGIFTMNNGTISGNNANIGGGVNNVGTFAMNAGIITGNLANTVTHGGIHIIGMGGGVNSIDTFIMRGGNISENEAALGVGVNISDGSCFTMYGGVISNNASSSAWWWGHKGGGVRIESESTFTMNGGSINDNNATGGGGIAIENSAFTMNGGTISGNTTADPGDQFYIIGESRGGGILIQHGTMTMNDGLISGNRTFYGGGGIAAESSTLTLNGGAIIENTAYGSASGGGVRLFPNSYFYMTDGEISGNHATQFGGGVRVERATFTMRNGEIVGNSTSVGGGVSMEIGTFTMHAGSINENTARSSGGGIHAGSSSIIMHGGEVNHNTASGGGGVHFRGSRFQYSTFIMNGGNISFNNAFGTGGGVIVEFNASFTMNNGEISNNTARTTGGGLRVARSGPTVGTFYYGTLHMTGGSITNNTAETGDGGGVFSDTHENYLNPLTPAAYRNITFEGGTIYGNTAGTGRYAVPINYYERSFGHLLNNYEINFRGSHRVEAIIFDLNGGNVGGDADDIEVMLPYDIQVGIENVPTVELFGYNLTGWLLGEELLTSAEVAGIIVDESMTLVAQWVRSPEYWFTITFAPGAQGAFTEQVFTDIFSGTATPAFVGTPTGNEGWLFTGWSPEIATTVTANVTYVAQWEEIVQPTPDPEYRTIRIYYYLEGYGRLVNDTANNAIGREYVREVGSTFSLVHVVDRNELDSDIDYVFEGWRVYLNDVYDNSYIDDINVNQLRGSFTVPESTGDGAALISLVAVWSIVDAQGGGNGDDNGDDNGSGSGDGNGDDDSDDNNETTTPPRDDNQKQALPTTGIEGDVFLWLALLALTIIVGLCVVAKVRGSKE